MSADFIDDVFPRISVDVNWQIFQVVPEQAKLFQGGEQRFERTKPGNMETRNRLPRRLFPNDSTPDFT
jgi:hypothetical protein